MPFNKNDQIRQRRAEVARLYLRGWFQSDIAARLGVTQQQISQDLGVIRKEWQSSSLRDFDELKDRELQKIDYLEQTYWAAWESSLQAKTRKSTKLKGKKNGPSDVEKTDTVEERLGDPRYLEGVRWCIQKRTDLLGLDAPVKSDVTLKGKPDWLNAAPTDENES